MKIGSYQILFITAIIISNITYSQSGSLDNSFGTSGIVKTSLMGMDGYVSSAALQKDGKIVVVGTRGSGNNSDFALVRYNIDGSLDISFDNDGMVWTDFESTADYGNSVAIQSDGKIILAGYKSKGDTYNCALARYNIDGSLDNSFGINGKVITAIGTENMGHSITVQSDGKILVAGWCNNGIKQKKGWPNTGVNNDFSLVRYNLDGTLDKSFGSDGIATTDFGSSDDKGYSIALQSDGKILVTGYTTSDGNCNFATVRYNINGTNDNTFDGDGIVTTGLGSLEDKGYSVSIQVDGKIVVAGESGNGSDIAISLIRYNADGSLDNSFDQDGGVLTNLGNYTDSGQSAVSLSDNKILVAGTSEYNVVLLKYNTDGSLETKFGDGGTVVKDIIKFDHGRAVLIQSDGQIIVAGNAGYNTNGFFETFIVMRFNK